MFKREEKEESFILFKTSDFNCVDYPKVNCLSLDPLIFHPLKTNNII